MSRLLWCVLLVAACGSNAPALAPPPPPPRVKALPPPPNLGPVDVTARVEASIDNPLLRDVDGRCLPQNEVSQRREAIVSTLHEPALVAALAAQGWTPITLAHEWDRREGEPGMEPTGGAALHEPWTVAEIGGARWIIGPLSTVNCGIDALPGGAARFITTASGEIYHLEVRTAPTSYVHVRACAVCPDGSGMCGAYMPATVQIRWKLPPGSTFAGHKTAGIEGPALEAPYDPPAKPCPRFDPPP